MHTITWNSKKVHYNKTGQGKAVFLIHGFGEDHTVWNRQVEFLQKKYCLYTPDLPGTGNSGFAEATLEDFSSIIGLMMETEGLDNIALIGHSMGGYISMAFAKNHGRKLNCLGLFHSSSYADDEDKKAARKKSISFIQENGAEAFLKTTIPSLFYSQEKNKKEIDELLAKGLKAETLIAYYSAMIKREDTSGVLETLDCPVLFILGTHDKAVPPEAGLSQSHLPKESHVHVLKNSAHMGMLEETDLSNEILADFLNHSIGT